MYIIKKYSHLTAYKLIIVHLIKRRTPWYILVSTVKLSGTSSIKVCAFNMRSLHETHGPMLWSLCCLSCTADAMSPMQASGLRVVCI